MNNVFIFDATTYTNKYPGLEKIETANILVFPIVSFSSIQ